MPRSAQDEAYHICVAQEADSAMDGDHSFEVFPWFDVVFSETEQELELPTNQQPVPSLKTKSASTDRTFSRASREIIRQAPLTLSERWTEMINNLRKPVIALLLSLSQRAARNPLCTMSFVVCLSIVLATVGYFTNFELFTDETTLWTPFDSHPVQHNAWIEKDSGFPAQSRELNLFFHSHGENVLGLEKVQYVFEALDRVRQLEDYALVCSESTFVDADKQPECRITGLVQFWNSSAAIYNDEVTSFSDLQKAVSKSHFPDGRPVPGSVIFGPTEWDNATSLLVSTISFTVIIELPDTPAALEFELDALDAVLDFRDSLARFPGNTFYVEVIAQRSFSDEFTRAIVKDIPLVAVVFLVMSAFTALVFARRHKVHSRSLLGVGAVVSTFFSIMSGYGLMFIIGVPFTPITQLLPFVIFGIGLDDSFIMMGSYLETSKTLMDPVERIRRTVEEVGLSISLTTMTTTLAFGLGCLSSIPAVYWLCMYAFPTVCFVFIYQLTFFVACIMLDERRIQMGGRDWCFWITVKDTMVDENYEHDEYNEDDDDDALKITNISSSSDYTIDAASNTDPLLTRCMGWYADQLLRPWVKVVTILIFGALAGLCAYSTSKLTQEFQVTDALPQDSYATEFTVNFDAYAGRIPMIPSVYFRFVNQSDPTVQSEMQAYVDELPQAMDAISSPPPLFWLRDFLTFLATVPQINSWPFRYQLDAFLSFPVFDNLYSRDLVRDADTGEIIASRCPILIDNVDPSSVQEQMLALNQQRAVTAQQPVNQGHDGGDWAFFTYHEVYMVWEFFLVSVDELLFSSVLGVVAVCAVALVFIPHWTAAPIILPLISILYVDLLGVMQWAGLHVNAVTYIAMVMSIGLFVDFLMHVLLRYYEAPGNRHEKVKDMIQTMGASVLLGGISTFLGIIPLAFTSSTIFYALFIAFLGLVTLGMGHGLILLPVLLSIFGPEEQVMIHHHHHRDPTVNRPKVDLERSYSTDSTGDSM